MKKRIRPALTPEQLALVVEALDSHAYWQLSDESNRNSGYVVDEDESPDLKECCALRDRLGKLVA